MVEGRIPPQAVEVEESILTALLLDVDFETVELKVDDFYKPANRHIFETMGKLYESGINIDIVTVCNKLKDLNLLDVVGGEGYVIGLTQSFYHAFEVPDYCEIVKEKSARRKIILSCNEVIKGAYDSTTELTRVVDDVSQIGLEEIGNKEYSLTPEQIKQRDIDNPKAEKLWFGYSELDYGIFSDSFRRGQVVLTLADSAHGKTAVTIALIKMLLQQGRYVHWFQLEGYDSETAQAIMDISNHENIKICDSLDDIEDIKRESRKINRERKKEGGGTDIIVFDYVQNIECSQKISKTEKVEYISRQITKLAKELNCVSNPLSQVTIENTRTGWQQEPRYNDVRWSKQLKQDASTMISVFRPSRIESLVENEKEVKDWNGNKVPYDSVFIKQVKVRHGKQEHKRFHMIHHDDGLKPYTDENYPF